MLNVLCYMLDFSCYNIHNMYNPKQQKIIEHTTQKVKELFTAYPVTSHDLNHTMRVVAFALEIAKREKANVFVCHLSALLHDVGRTEEFYKKKKGQHHELSYKICQNWFKQDKILNTLAKKEKIEILYAVRYHYNNVADQYFSAVILRDADKLDLYGKKGLKRLIDFWGEGTEALGLNLRLSIEASCWLYTVTAEKIFVNNKMIEPILIYYKKYLKKKISRIEL